jgi:hypothetical protein
VAAWTCPEGQYSQGPNGIGPYLPIGQPGQLLS